MQDSPVNQLLLAVNQQEVVGNPCPIFISDNGRTQVNAGAIAPGSTKHILSEDRRASRPDEGSWGYVYFVMLH